jgi:hypothetical protein
MPDLNETDSPSSGGAGRRLTERRKVQNRVRQLGILSISHFVMSLESADIFLEHCSKNVSRLLNDYCSFLKEEIKLTSRSSQEAQRKYRRIQRPN